MDTIVYEPYDSCRVCAPVIQYAVLLSWPVTRRVDLLTLAFLDRVILTTITSTIRSSCSSPEVREPIGDARTPSSMSCRVWSQAARANYTFDVLYDASMGRMRIGHACVPWYPVCPIWSIAQTWMEPHRTACIRNRSRRGVSRPITRTRHRRSSWFASPRSDSAAVRYVHSFSALRDAFLLAPNLTWKSKANR